MSDDCLMYPCAAMEAASADRAALLARAEKAEAERDGFRGQRDDERTRAELLEAERDEVRAEHKRVFAALEALVDDVEDDREDKDFCPVCGDSGDSGLPHHGDCSVVVAKRLIAKVKG